MIHVFDRRRDQTTEDYLEKHTGRVRRIAWLPDGTVISADEAGSLILWSLVPRKAVQTHLVAGGGITDFAIHEETLALACRDGVVRLWSTSPLKQIGELSVGHKDIKQAVFFLGGKYVAATGIDGWVTLHETDSRLLNCEFNPPPLVTRVAAHPARPIVAAAVQGDVWLLDVNVSPPSSRPPVDPANVGAMRGLGARDVEGYPPTTSAPLAPPATQIGHGLAPEPRGQGIPVTPLARPRKTRMPDPVRILFMAANPSNLTRLRLGAESTKIKEALAGAGKRERFTFAEEHSIRLDSLQRVLLQQNATIVHFSGHGAADGSLVFEDESGVATEADPEALAESLRLVGGIRLIVLNACFSRRQADCLARHVDAVVGMGTAIPDATAIAFAKSLYESLGEGRELSNAFELAKSYVRLNRLPGDEIPELVMRATVTL